jgi:glycosyltransferase involved in cell wall biosynthesis
MRILHVNKFFDFHGGAEFYVHELIEKQQVLGHDVHIFTTKRPGTPPHPDDRFSTAYHAYDRREGIFEDAKKGVNFLWNAQARRQFSLMLDELKPEVVHLHNLYHHLSSSILEEIRARKIPCVQTLHDYKLACPNYKMFTKGSVCERCKTGGYTEAIKNNCLGSFGQNLLAAAEMQFTKVTAAYETTVKTFLCPSKFMQEKMIAWGEPAGKMAYLPNPTAIPAKTATRDGGYVLYTGRLSVEKGLDVFLKGAALVPDVPVWIAGKGPEEPRLRKLVEELGAAHVRFLGFVPPDELRGIRDRADAIIMPTRMYENASGALLEGLAAGIPCLASDIGGNPEIVEDGKSGWLVPPEDADGWKRTLIAFSKTSDTRRREMGEYGRAMIQRERTWTEHVKKLEEIYRF